MYCFQFKQQCLLSSPSLHDASSPQWEWVSGPGAACEQGTRGYREPPQTEPQDKTLHQRCALGRHQEGEISRNIIWIRYQFVCEAEVCLCSIKAKYCNVKWRLEKVNPAWNHFPHSHKILLIPRIPLNLSQWNRSRWQVLTFDVTLILFISLNTFFLQTHSIDR